MFSPPLFNSPLPSEMMERPYYMDYSSARLVIHKMVTSKYFDLAISAVIGLNVITMAMEFYMMPDVSIDNSNLGLHHKYLRSLSTRSSCSTTSSLGSSSSRLAWRSLHSAWRDICQTGATSMKTLFLLILYFQMEPAGRCYCVPVYNWNCTGRDWRPSFPDQSDDHPSDAGSANCTRSQTSQNGQRNPCTPGHRDAGAAPGECLLIPKPSGARLLRWATWVFSFSCSSSYLPLLALRCSADSVSRSDMGWRTLRGQNFICYSRVRPLRWF